jgi:hypothetical protein
MHSQKKETALVKKVFGGSATSRDLSPRIGANARLQCGCFA